MLSLIAAVQIFVFCSFFFAERVFPNRNHPIPKRFTLWWLCLGLFGLMWLRLMLFIWPSLQDGLITISAPTLVQGFIFYLVYSFGNYWFHRWKHRNSFLWNYFHKLHHSTSHMETRIAFYRHPLEILINTLYLIILGKIVFSLSFEVIAIALAIEGCLEAFHHANIKIPEKFSRLGYLIQLPDMHLVHHEYGLHRYNYAPFLWDSVFGTVKIPKQWDKRLGFARSAQISEFFFFKKRA